MSKKVMIAKEVRVPENLPELLDKRAGEEPGHYRSLVAQSGDLHELELRALATAMMTSVKETVERTDLPGGGPMTFERFENTMFMVCMAYTTGVIEVSDEGVVRFGGPDAMAHVSKLLDHDEIRLTNGAVLPVKEFISHMQDLTSKEALQETWDDFNPNKGVHSVIKRGKVPSIKWFKVTYAAIKSAQDIMRHMKEHSKTT